MSADIYHSKYITTLISVAIPNKYTKWYCNIVQKALHRSSSRKQAKILLGAPVEGHHILPKCFNMGGEKDKNNLVYLTTKEHFIVHHILCKMFLDQRKYMMWHAITQFARKTRKLNARQIAISMAFKHRPCSEERANNISIARKNTQKIKCKYCNKETDPGNHRQFHGENCKIGPNSDQIKIDRKLKRQEGMLTGKLNGTFKDIKTRVEAKGGDIHAHNHITRTCPHCGLTGKGPVMLQKHFDKCPKQISINLIC